MRMYSPARRGGAAVRAALASSIVYGLLATAALANDDEGFEQHHAHEHGKVTLNVAVDRDTLAVELDAPAANVIGFEHEPRTEAERKAVLSAASWIRKGDGLFRTPDEAGCRFVRTEFHDPVWEHDDAHADAHHEHEHEHEHEDHADYEARFLYRCADSTRLSWIEPSLLARLLNLKEAQVNIVGPAGQRSETVNDAHTRIRLR